MDRRLIGYYNRELQHLREVGGEFAREFPKIAGRLNLDEFGCADPYVERLLEGFAFMAARVQVKLDAEFPRVTQALLETLYPTYLAPTPSMAVVQFQVDPNDASLAEGVPVPRGTALRGVLGRGEQTACEYRTAHDLRLLPLRVTDAKYVTRELTAMGVPAGTDARAGIRLRLALGGGVKFDAVKLGSLCFYLRAAPDLQMRLYEQLFAHCRGVAVQRTTRAGEAQTLLPPACLRPVGFEPGQSMLPTDPRVFTGYRLLQEYFAFPQRFLFFSLDGLDAAAKRCGGSEVDVILLLDEPDLHLENNVDASNFAPFCTPAINLFPRRCDRIHLSDKSFENQVIPDRTRPRDFEVYQVTKVTGHGVRADQQQEFAPFYSVKSGDDDGRAYYAMNRTPRMVSANEQRQGQRSKYAGSEAYLSLVDSRSAPYSSDLKQLAVEATCTNRDLPLFLPVGRGATDFTVDTGAPVQAIRCVSGVPTPPQPSHAFGEFSWRLISQLSLNYLSLTDGAGDSGTGRGAAALRDLLRLYGESAEPHIRRQIEGVRTVSSKPTVARVPAPGPIAFARGLEVTLTLDEAAFEGTGVFLLGSVLEQFFARQVTINSFTRTVLATLERGVVMRWPARLGERRVL
jgi:type VI secretion system protein ImpG